MEIQLHFYSTHKYILIRLKTRPDKDAKAGQRCTFIYRDGTRSITDKTFFHWFM